MQLNEFTEFDFNVQFMEFGNQNLELLVADENGDLRILKIKDNLVMEDKKNIPQPTVVFNEPLKITGLIFDNPHLVASSDKGHILF